MTFYFNPKKEAKEKAERRALLQREYAANSGHVEIVFIGCFGAEATVR